MPYSTNFTANNCTMKVLIVGGGITGQCLAYQFASNGHHVQLIDNWKSNCSTSVAGALVNPIHLKYQKWVWKGLNFFNYANAFYNNLNDSEISAVRRIPVIHFLENTSEINDWSSKVGEGSPFSWFSTLPEELNPQISAGMIDCSIVVNPDRIRELLLSKESIIVSDEQFNYQELGKSIPDGEWSYHGRLYDKVIFAEGVGILNNPWFSWVPVVPNKGELLEIDWPRNREYIWHKKFFILPIGDNGALAGATYNKSDLSITPTELGAKEIRQGIAGFYSGPIEIRSKRVGIRPTSPDRKPIVGAHPEEANLYIMNGMGSRAFLMAPWLAKHLVEHITLGKELLQEVDLNRWLNKYWLMV